MKQPLPLTPEAFEQVVQDVTAKFNLKMDDDMRVMTISYFHSLDRTIFEFDDDTLGAFLHKATSNDMTYHIGQEIHEKRLQAAAEKLKAEESAKPNLSIVDTPTETITI